MRFTTEIFWDAERRQNVVRLLDHRTLEAMEIPLDDLMKLKAVQYAAEELSPSPEAA